MAHSVYKYRTGEAYPHCYKYPQAAVTADCVVFSYDCKELKVLLIKRGRDPFKDCWAFPGGFVNPDETVEQGAVRELVEETSLRVEFMEQLKVFSTPDRDPRQRVMTVPFLCLSKNVEAVGGDDAAQASWFPVDKLPALAFDHGQIMEEARKVLKRLLLSDNIARYLMPQTFTMPQLHRLYEQIMGCRLDRRNFARKMNSLGILETQERESGLPSRIASVYSFK